MVLKTLSKHSSKNIIDIKVILLEAKSTRKSATKVKVKATGTILSEWIWIIVLLFLLWVA